MTQLPLVSASTNNAQRLISNNLFGHRAYGSTGMQLRKCIEDVGIELKKNNSDIINTEILSHNQKCSNLNGSVRHLFKNISFVIIYSIVFSTQKHVTM